MPVNKTGTATISGKGPIYARYVKDFLDNIPESARIKLKESKEIEPGVFGPWEITAVWEFDSY